MKTQAGKSSYRSLLIAGIVAILFSTGGMARVMGWGPGSTMESGAIPALGQTAPVPAASAARAGPRCPECGMIVSIRNTGMHDEDSGTGATGGAAGDNRDESRVSSPGYYEIVVRMADGSSRLINVVNPARWRTGERLIVVSGTAPSNR